MPRASHDTYSFRRDARRDEFPSRRLSPSKHIIRVAPVPMEWEHGAMLKRNRHDSLLVTKVDGDPALERIRIAGKEQRRSHSFYELLKGRRQPERLSETPRGECLRECDDIFLESSVNAREARKPFDRECNATRQSPFSS